MAWFDEAVFYHIYPLGLTGAEERNPYGAPQHRLRGLLPWIDHIRGLGCTGLYIGPLFESAGHGYDTTDYFKVDSRLGTNDDLHDFVDACHKAGIRVILDGVFNHTGRDFFAFQDLREKRENSAYLDWYCNVDFWGNNEYNDGFSYANWGGYNELVKLNLKNPAVRDHLLHAVRMWHEWFGIDGLRLDTADVLDFDFMRSLRALANELSPDFWLMGEVIHGEYERWVNAETLHAVTNYHLHKALYSAHNDHNYFEIAHTVKRQQRIASSLYTFVDNHDVDRIMSKLKSSAHFLPVHILLFTLPGIPSLYYGSEFGIQGTKARGSDAPLRPCLDLEALTKEAGTYADLVRALGQLRNREPALIYGEYRELALATGSFAYARGDVLVTVCNEDRGAHFELPARGEYTGALTGEKKYAEGGRLRIDLAGNSGEIWLPAGEAHRWDSTLSRQVFERIGQKEEAAKQEEAIRAELPSGPANEKPLEGMSVQELQQEVLRRLARNGQVTDRMRREVSENVYPDSLRNWVRSFR